MKIKNFTINKESQVFIIAELSANHNGSLETALETVRAAKRAGADCIKLQT
jgi:pseudaminic acid synthase